ncbi:MAG: G5 domain-containing protein [Chloroflexi bacterium]|nr:G5 domain-containing protein [Chloroflexota bacterium]
MPEPQAGTDAPNNKRSGIGSRPQSQAAHPFGDRLHLALAVSLAAVVLVLIALPLTRSSVSAEEPNSTPVLVVSEAFSASLQSQAQTLVSALTAVGPAATPRDTVLTQSLDGFPGAPLVPRSVLTAAAGVLVQGALAGSEGQPGFAMELQKPVGLTLHEGVFSSEVFSTRPTVGGALAALGAEYNNYDLVSPPPDTPLTAGLHVFLKRASRVSLSVGGEELPAAYTQAETVAALLAERDVQLSGGDYVIPALSTPLRNGLAVSVTIVGEKIEVVETPIPFRTIYRDDPTLTQGQSAVSQVGLNGNVIREYAVLYRNGEEVSRELLSEIIVAPDHEIIVQGTAVVAVAAVVSAPSGDPDCARTVTVWATWYTAASAGGSGTTATGTTVQKGTVAVDPSVIPLGTRMYIPGYGDGVAEDTGGAIIGNIIDLGYGPDDVWDWYSRYVDICILN